MTVATDVIIMTGAFTGQDNEDNASVDCCILNFMMHIVCMITQCFFKSSRHLKADDSISFSTAFKSNWEKGYLLFIYHRKIFCSIWNRYFFSIWNRIIFSNFDEIYAFLYSFYSSLYWKQSKIIIFLKNPCFFRIYLNDKWYFIEITGCPDSNCKK